MSKTHLIQLNDSYLKDKHIPKKVKALTLIQMLHILRKFYLAKGTVRALKQCQRRTGFSVKLSTACFEILCCFQNFSDAENTFLTKRI